MAFDGSENWIGFKEVAEYLGVKPSTVRDLKKKTDIPTNKVGKQWRFKKSELDTWIKSGKSAF